MCRSRRLRSPFPQPLYPQHPVVTTSHAEAHLLQPLDLGPAQLQVAVSWNHDDPQRHSCTRGHRHNSGTTLCPIPNTSHSLADGTAIGDCGCHPRSLSWSLTGFLELFLVVVQCLIVTHADSAHPDPQPLRHWLLAVCRGEGKGKGSESDSPLSPYPTHPSKQARAQSCEPTGAGPWHQQLLQHQGLATLL